MRITNFEATGLDAVERFLQSGQTVSQPTLRLMLATCNVSFVCEGINRLQSMLLCELKDSYVQQSQRYVKFTDGLATIKPESVAADEGASAVFDEAVRAAIEAYERLLAAGIPAEDARYLLPNAAETKIVITMNVRELLHFFSLRCCNRAQWEIRDMAHRMLELARPTAPFIFADAGAPCVRGTCPEGKMTCGNPYPKVTRE